MADRGAFTVSSERAMPVGRHLLRWFMIALGVVIAAHTSKGISYNGADSIGPYGLGTLALVVLVLTVLNVVIRPILILFALPFVVLTLGFGLLLINAFLFWLATKLVPGFYVVGFWSAFWGSLVVTVMSLIANFWLGRRRFIASTRGLGARAPNSPTARRDDDVIDV
ncbi:MAG TPA: phage holin family protein [Opitutales bacterium]|nr:phage holin family protein [Opitutales bacterium]